MTEFTKYIQEWLAECYSDYLQKTAFVDYNELKRFVLRRIFLSDLADSTVREYGLSPIDTDGNSQLSGSPLLVQIMAVSETIEHNVSRTYKLRLSDGSRIYDAVARAASPIYDLGFFNMELGYKVRQNQAPSSTVYDVK